MIWVLIVSKALHVHQVRMHFKMRTLFQIGFGLVNEMEYETKKNMR